ncbi:hypothetical protein [Methanobrevibacter sp.]|uniref:hypothetical protein n=1 Tax=Methanobrevibacter sp. TaxID=66852 RepID=UPI00388EFB02
MNVTGHYIFKSNEKIILQGTNIITRLGESFFMNRLVNSEFKALQYIMLGTSKIQPQKTDLQLGNETVRKKAYYEIDLKKKQIKLSCSCSLSEVLNTTEIGTSEGNILISHDTYQRITKSMLGNVVDSIEIEYIFNFSTSSIKKNWLYYNLADVEAINNIYYTPEENMVVRVTEENYSTAQTGYHAVNSVDDLKTSHGAYYYDPFSKNLFIRTLNDEDPNNSKIAVTTR